MVKFSGHFYKFNTWKWKSRALDRWHSSRMIKRCVVRAAIFTFIATSRTDTRNERRLMELHFYSHTGWFSENFARTWESMFVLFLKILQISAGDIQRYSIEQQRCRTFEIPSNNHSTRRKQRDVKFHNNGSKRGITRLFETIGLLKRSPLRQIKFQRILEYQGGQDKIVPLFLTIFPVHWIHRVHSNLT